MPARLGLLTPQASACLLPVDDSVHPVQCQADLRASAVASVPATALDSSVCSCSLFSFALSRCV